MNFFLIECGFVIVRWMTRGLFSEVIALSILLRVGPMPIWTLVRRYVNYLVEMKYISRATLKNRVIYSECATMYKYVLNKK